jgi:hypothetical protein
MITPSPNSPPAGPKSEAARHKPVAYVHFSLYHIVPNLPHYSEAECLLDGFRAKSLTDSVGLGKQRVSQAGYQNALGRYSDTSASLAANNFVLRTTNDTFHARPSLQTIDRAPSTDMEHLPICEMVPCKAMVV